MTQVTALNWCARLLALAVFFQTLELFICRRAWSDTGVWRWILLRGDYRGWPSAIRLLLDACLNARSFCGLLGLRLICCVAIGLPVALPNGVASFCLGVLFFSTWLIAIRWRGTFNGGSDTMTVLIALSLWVAELSPPSISHGIARACLAYVAVQLTASYAISGWVKLRNPDWRSGLALPALLKQPGYDNPPAWLLGFLESPRATRIACGLLIAFECSAPLAWIGPRTCLAFLGGALIFHLACFQALGLNRFVFAWLAAYPALLFWSQRG